MLAGHVEENEIPVFQCSEAGRLPTAYFLRSKQILRLAESGPRNDRRRRKNEYKSRRMPYMATDPPLIFRCQSCATSPLYRFPQNHHHPTALFFIA